MLGQFSRFFQKKLADYREDQSGGVVMMFTMASIVLVLVAAGAIEMQRRSKAMVELQNAADVAALAGKKKQILAKATMTLAASQAEGTKVAKQMFNEIMAKSKYFSPPPPFGDTWNASGSYTLKTDTKYDMSFGKVLPTKFAELSIKSTVDVRNSMPTEVAMVLDTTASMFNKDGRSETRFTLMRNAAKKFTHQMFNAAQATGTQNLVRMSVVPWATSVNVLGGAPAAADFTGDAPVANIADKGSQQKVTNPMGRGGVSQSGSGQFKPVEWRGCVNGETESPTLYDDTKPANFNALRVQPAPTVDVTLAEGPLKNTPVTSCTCTQWQPATCGPGNGTQGFRKLIEDAVPQIRSAAFLFDRNVDTDGNVTKAQCSACTAQTCSTSNQMLPDCTNPTKTKTLPFCYIWGNGGRRNSFVEKKMDCTDYWGGCFEKGKMPDPISVEPCVADPNEPGIISGTVTWCPAYYQPGSKAWDGLVDGFSPEIAGPNLNCPAPMLGLSGNRKQVIEYLDRLTPVPGGTHADVGLRWGLRTLAATNDWPKFFGLSGDPAPWGNSAQKLMILITDGENEQAKDFPGYWGCSQQDGDHPDCKGSPDAAELDSRMQGWCKAIRETYKTKIFAIAVNFNNATAVSGLKSCAGDEQNVYSVDAADLSKVLEAIAAQVMSLRLTQ